MTLPQAVAEALRLISSDARVVTAEIEVLSKTLSDTVQYRFVKDKQSERSYRVERRKIIVSESTTGVGQWATSPGFDVDDVLGECVRMSITLPAQDAPAPGPFPNFFDLVELVSAQHRHALADVRSLRADRDKLRGVVEALLAVLGKTVPADEIARWRELAGLPEAPP